jgi:hypothetical protein
VLLLTELIPRWLLLLLLLLLFLLRIGLLRPLLLFYDFISLLQALRAMMAATKSTADSLKGMGRMMLTGKLAAWFRLERCQRSLAKCHFTLAVYKQASTVEQCSLLLPLRWGAGPTATLLWLHW